MSEDQSLLTATPTNTPTLTPTSTPAPTLTSTPAPTLTSTPAPTLTSTPVPTRTSTPAPTPTSTSAPTPTNTSAPTPTTPGGAAPSSTRGTTITSALTRTSSNESFGSLVNNQVTRGATTGSTTCPPDQFTGSLKKSKILPQTLFLGASVMSFSTNMGWGGQPSTLTVELISDSNVSAKCKLADGKPIPVFKPGNYPDNHYYECSGDECYVDENGDPYDSRRVPPPLEKKIPGKVFYAWTKEKGLVSRYWFYEDPGFYGDATRVAPDGTYSDDVTSYDIIGVPVYFVLDEFIFGGIVKSWEKNNRQGQITYTVNIEGIDSVLENSWLILKDYAGSIFTKLNPESSLGGPLSYVGPGVINYGTTGEGNIPNVFNIYGFLESFSDGNFGGASVTDEGIAYSDVINALTVLTSCAPRGEDDAGQLNDLNKRAFSPFGRIITRTIQENGSYYRPKNDIGMGVIPSTVDASNVERNSFILDLSELPRPPSTYKYTGDVVSVMDFIRNLTSEMGKDFYTTLIPAVINDKPYNIIKIKVIDRNVLPAQNQISSTVTALQSAGYSVSVDNIGKEQNSNGTSRVLYIGGKQERLFQAKNYRLGYRQTSYIYQPATDSIVNFNFPNGGKAKWPAYFSTRNYKISSGINGADNTAIFNQVESIKQNLDNSNFDTPDGVWADTEVGGSETPPVGNYYKSTTVRSGFKSGSDSLGSEGRYIPIYMDTICPFFGYVLEDKIEISTDGGSNNFRKIRPVWLDSWTGQLVIVCTVDELPPLTIGSGSLLRTTKLRAFDEQGIFLITESEMRAAMVNFDSYLTYCCSKSLATKPHLYSMLLAAYYYANPQLAELFPNSWARTGFASGAAHTPPGHLGIVQISDGNNNNREVTDWIIDGNFIKDLMALSSFVANIAQRYYGRQYMVRMGGFRAYKDSAYADLEIPAYSYNSEKGNSIAVFSGSGKIYFNIEPSNNGAWEEPGNVIDDSIMVGSAAWYTLVNEQGKIPPLLGYNASDTYDYEGKRQCMANIAFNSKILTTTDQRRNIIYNYLIGGGSGDQGGMARVLFGDRSINRNVLGNIRVLQNEINILLQRRGRGDPLNNPWTRDDELNLRKKLSELSKLNPGLSINEYINKYKVKVPRSGEVLKIDLNSESYSRWFLTAQGVCSDDKFIFPSLSINSLNKDDFVVLGTYTPRQDPYGKLITPGVLSGDIRPPILKPDLTLEPFNKQDGMSKKLFVKSNVIGVGFMDPINLQDPRAILSSPGILLNPPSLSMRIDPTLTVKANVALEDLIVYLKMTTGYTLPYSQSYVETLLTHIRGYNFFADTKVDKNGTRSLDIINFSAALGVWWPNGSYTNNVSASQARIHQKYAHPYFAGVPFVSNQYCYGPWTNYPSLFSDQIFIPGIRAELESYRNELNYYTRILNSQYTDINMRTPLVNAINLLSKKIKRFIDGLEKFNGRYAVENLISNTKVEINPDLVPWNYGGMSFVDNAVLSLIDSNTDFQHTLESARVTIASTPIFGIGGEFIFNSYSNIPPNTVKYNSELYQLTQDTFTYSDIKTSTVNSLSDAIPIPDIGSKIYLPSATTAVNKINVNYNIISARALNRTGLAPVVTNMSVGFDINGFSTTYSFKTYARRLGLYSKQASDRLKKAAQKDLQAYKNIFRLKNNSVIADSQAFQDRRMDFENQRTSMGEVDSKLFGTSPTEVLIGGAAGYAPVKQAIDSRLNASFSTIKNDGTISLPSPPISYSINGKDAGDLPIDYSDITTYQNKYRHRAWVGMFQKWETRRELETAYEQKSAMSLDGIFSPVSFYPTTSDSTYAMLPYPQPICPDCRGTHLVSKEVHGLDSENQTTIIKRISIQCPSCARGLPKYVVDPTYHSGVNALNLQPVVVPYAWWNNAHAQSSILGERQRHSIRVIGRNQLPPFFAYGLSLDTDDNKETFINPDTGSASLEGDGYNLDFSPTDVVKTRTNGNVYLNNHRFFALRGPLMLHGWGYDTSGNPVPNASDEPRALDIEGRPLRFRLTSSGTNDYKADGLFLPEGTQYGLGDIIGRGWEKENGEWIRKPSEYFYLNWAERPDLWPVGPIDLRWDRDRGVWTGGGSGGTGGCTGNDFPPYIIAEGINDIELLAKYSTLDKGKCSYKLIYIVLEENLVKEDGYDETYPVRAFIDDIQYSKQPLPNNTRRLVFVKDRSGYTAPRGAKLLCRYDNDTGFYEPVSKPTYFVFGTITSGNNAIIDLSYIQGKHRGENVPTMSINFDNQRFNFDIKSNSKGMFYFENGKWILISTKL